MEIATRDGVLIVSERDDLHALMIQDEIRRRGERCFLIASDDLHGAESVHFYCTSAGPPQARIKAACGSMIDPSRFATLWWRRYRPDQSLDDALAPDQRALINNDCVAALRGALEATFKGRWVSLPSATERASNKPLQLAAAARAGFSIPATLITQSPSALRDFAEPLERVIYKPVAGTRGPLLFTRFLDPDDFPDDTVRSSPTLYQEYVRGTRHLRLNAFGPRCLASLIETDALDWRPDLTVPISHWEVDARLQALVRACLDALSLEMGVFDIKITPENDYVFLEVNPQGQFLFLEGATGAPLARHMADFLLS